MCNGNTHLCSNSHDVHNDHFYNSHLHICLSHIDSYIWRQVAIVNDDSSIVIKFEASLTNDARVIIYDRHMFIVKATGVFVHANYC